ncbi:MAG: 4Fe-4S dicluster domain-containing protein [Clostridia bacterium]|nr:4Fe-4S dicluster domain-containing protein [Clostridia bacterium]
MAPYKHSVALDTEKCKGCITCLKRCPTEAIRIRNGHAVINPDRCIDCGECIRQCPHKAKKAVADKLSELPFGKKFVIALPPPSLYGQFENLDDADYILQGLLDIGFDYVYEVARAAELVTEYTRQYLKREDIRRPVISSACPVVTRLISLRFPYLCDNLVPMLSPMEIAAAKAKDEALEKNPGLKREDIVTVFISPCPAKVSAVKNDFAGHKSNVDYVVAVNEVYFELLGAMGKIDSPSPISKTGMVGMSWAVSGGEASALLNDRYLAADGIENIIKVLDELETASFPFLDYIELNACSSGCVGGVMTVGNPYLTKVKIQNLKRYLPVMQNRPTLDEAKQIPEEFSYRQKEYEPVARLDSDRIKAMSLMKEILVLDNKLPGFDCGACGSPTCRAFAEDVIKEKAMLSDCVFLERGEKK